MMHGLIPASIHKFYGGFRRPIQSGVNRGMKWSIASWGRGYGRGDFESTRVRLIQGLAHPGETVWDVGAHKGFVTFAASTLESNLQRKGTSLCRE